MTSARKKRPTGPASLRVLFLYRQTNGVLLVEVPLIPKSVRLAIPESDFRQGENLVTEPANDPNDHGRPDG